MVRPPLLDRLLDLLAIRHPPFQHSAGELGELFVRGEAQADDAVAARLRSGANQGARPVEEVVAEMIEAVTLRA